MKKRYEVVLTSRDGMWNAYCRELCVNGVGESQDDAIKMLVVAMRSTLAADAAALKTDPMRIRSLASIFMPADCDAPLAVPA